MLILDDIFEDVSIYLVVSVNIYLVDGPFLYTNTTIQSQRSLGAINKVIE